MNWWERRPCRRGLWRRVRRIGLCGGRWGVRVLWGGIGGTLAVDMNDWREIDGLDSDGCVRSEMDTTRLIENE